MRCLLLLTTLNCALSPALALERFEQAKAGDLLEVRLSQLHPTQSVLGFDQIYYKLGRFQVERHKLFDEYCETNGQGEASQVPRDAHISDSSSFACQAPVGTYASEMKTVVVGPEGTLYLTDGHHTLTTFWEQPGAGPEYKMWVKVTDNYSDSADLSVFWQRMSQARKVWLKDGQNQDIEVNQLPSQLGLARFSDDAYRSLVYFAREVAYDKPRSGDVRPEFLEFYWGQWLRSQVNLAQYSLDNKNSYRDAVLAASRAMVELEPEAKVGEAQYSAAQLGGYNRIDYKELSKVSKSKLTHMTRYKAALQP